MSRSLRMQIQGGSYYVSGKGPKGKKLFQDSSDKRQFLHHLASASKRFHAVFHAYYLLPNEYGVLLKTPLGNLSHLMHNIHGAYSRYYKDKYPHPGTLFRGRYQSVLLDFSLYGPRMSGHLHLRPCLQCLSARPHEYSWSSCSIYLGREIKPSWLNTEDILSRFGETKEKAYKRYGIFLEALGTKKEDPLEKIKKPYVLGDDAFVNDMIKWVRDSENSQSRGFVVTTPESVLTLDALYKEVEKYFGNKAKECRRATMFLGHRYSGRTLEEIGEYFNVTPSAVTQASRRMTLRLREDSSLQQKMRQVIQFIQNEREMMRKVD